MSYIEVTAKYDKMTENGEVKKVSEKCLCDALSTVEATARVIEELQPYVNGEIDVTANKKVGIAEVFGDKEADEFYLAKVNFVTIDEKTAKEKKTASQWLIGADNFEMAYGVLTGEVVKILADVEIASLAETPIVEYYPAKP